MTDRELRKLKRTELLELMYYLKEELENVKQENEILKGKLEAQSAGQGDATAKILERVNDSAKKIDELYKAAILKNEQKDPEKDSQETEL